MPAAELGPRQVWWVATAACTALSLGLLAYSRSPLLAALALLLLVAPHLVGAPLPPSHDTEVPAALEARFVNAVFATNLIFWAVLGTLAGLLRQRFRAGEEATVGANAGLARR
jgi:cobalt transporter subunit CbtA